MKFQCLAFLAIAAVCPVTAKPADTCLAQSECMKITIEEASAGACEGECEFKVCFIRSNSGSCQKSDGDTFSHWCQKDSDVCASTDGFGDATEMQGLEYGYEDCQTVGPDSEVEFLIKDGKGCDNEDEYSITAIVGGVSGEYTGTCEPRPADIESCTGNGVGKECVWTFTTPSCSGGGEDTTTEEPDTTAEPPATTEEPPATTEEPPATTEEPPATTEAPPGSDSEDGDSEDGDSEDGDSEDTTTEDPAPPPGPDTTPNPSTAGDPQYVPCVPSANRLVSL